MGVSDIMYEYADACDVFMYFEAIKLCDILQYMMFT
jgi:hypothetical protein